MSNEQPNNPLHGITLKTILEQLVNYYGWDQLGLFIEINCFNYKPSLTSSLRFLRSTPWARAKVERLYIIMQDAIEEDQQSPNEFEPPPSGENQKTDQLNTAAQQALNESNIIQEVSEKDETTEQQEPKKFKFEYRGNLKKSPD